MSQTEPDTETVVEPEDLEPGDAVVVRSHGQFGGDTEFVERTVESADHLDGWGDAWEIALEEEGGMFQKKHLSGQDEDTQAAVFYPEEK